jgi:hypothetical protein
MPTTEDMHQTHAQDLASLLSQLPREGTDDDVSRLMDVYESAERSYRAAVLAGTPVIGASSSANR